jgi:hypothetical protein
MTALPMTLETALRHQGYTIDPAEVDAFTITVGSGSIAIPAMVTSVLTWQRDEDPALGDDLYLSKLPIFAEAYRPVLLSQILDRYRTRRLGYNTPGEWRLAFRRWGNLNMTVPNQRYASTAVALPLDDRDSIDATEATAHSLDVESDFPQSLVSGSTDYATSATDNKTADNATVTRTGRDTSIMRLLAEQRDTYLNVDLEVLDGLDSLFLSVLDQGEGAPGNLLPPTRFDPFGTYAGRGW